MPNTIRGPNFPSARRTPPQQARPRPAPTILLKRIKPERCRGWQPERGIHAAGTPPSRWFALASALAAARTVSVRSRGGGGTSSDGRALRGDAHQHPHRRNQRHQKTLNRLVRFIDQFKQMNFANDLEMERQLERVRMELLSKTAEEYRDRSTARNRLTAGLQQLGRTSTTVGAPR